LVLPRVQGRAKFHGRSMSSFGTVARRAGISLTPRSRLPPQSIEFRSRSDSKKMHFHFGDTRLAVIHGVTQLIPCVSSCAGGISDQLSSVCECPFILCKRTVQGVLPEFTFWGQQVTPGITSRPKSIIRSRKRTKFRASKCRCRNIRQPTSSTTNGLDMIRGGRCSQSTRPTPSSWLS